LRNGVHKVLVLCKTVQVVPYSIGHGADPNFLAVSPQVILVINLVVGCHYFPQGQRLLSQPEISRWPVPNYTAWWQRHTGVSSLPRPLHNGVQTGLEPATCKSKCEATMYLAIFYYTYWSSVSSLC